MRRLALTICAWFIACGAIFAQQPQTSDVSGTQPLYAVNAKYVNGTAPGYWPTKSTGLVLNISAGTCFVGGAISEYAGGTLTMTAGSTNYVFLDNSTCALGSRTSSFGTGDIPIAEVTTDGTDITAIKDRRTAQIATGGGGGGGGSRSFGAITSGINNIATMTMDTGSTLNGAASGSEVADFRNFDPLSFYLPVKSGAAPTADGNVGVDSTSHALLFGSNGSTKSVATWAGDIAGGTALVPQVVGLRGYTLASASLGGPDTGKVITWNGTQFDYEFSASGITGAGLGVNNTVTKWTGASSLGLTGCTDDGTTFSCTDTGGISAVKFTTTGSAPGLLDFTEGTAPSGVAAHDLLWADSTAHWWSIINNNGTTYQLVGILGNATIGRCATFDSAHSITDSGCTAGTVTHTGTLTSGRIIDGNGGADITVGDLSGDTTTSGSLVTTTVKVNSVSYSSGPSTHQVPVITASNTATYKTLPPCTDTGGNHLNFDQSTNDFSCGTSGGGGGSGAPSMVPLEGCAPDTSGDIFWTVVGLTNWRDGHWEFNKAASFGGTDVILYCKARVPHTLPSGTAKLILSQLSANDSTASHTMTFKTCDIAISTTVNAGSLSCASTQNFTTTSTAYAPSDLTFNVQSSLSADTELIVAVHATAESSLSNDVLMEGAYLQWE